MRKIHNWTKQLTLQTYRVEQCGTALPPDKELMKNCRDDDSEDYLKLVADREGTVYSEEGKVFKQILERWSKAHIRPRQEWGTHTRTLIQQKTQRSQCKLVRKGQVEVNTTESIHKEISTSLSKRLQTNSYRTFIEMIWSRREILKDVKLHCEQIMHQFMVEWL